MSRGPSGRLADLLDAMLDIEEASRLVESETGRKPTGEELVAAATLVAARSVYRTDRSPRPGPTCPDCGGPMWDNRKEKTEGARPPKTPDFKCKRQDCGKRIWLSGPHDLAIVLPNEQ